MKKLVIAGAVLATALSGSASAAPFINATFTSGFGPFTAAGNVGIANGATYAPCCGTPASYTNNFVAFGGGNASSGALSTTFGTVLGRLYQVAFDYGAVGGGSEPLTFTVGATPFTVTPTANNNLPAFQSTSFTFIGTGSPTTLSITSGGLNNVDAIIDNVSVSSVPEPAVWGLMILGFGAIGATMRRRAKVRTTVSYA